MGVKTPSEPVFVAHKRGLNDPPGDSLINSPSRAEKYAPFMGVLE